MVTVDDLSPGCAVPEPMVVEVTAIEWDPGKSRRAEVELVDTVGNPLHLVDYAGANLSVKWRQNHRYRIAHCDVNNGGQTSELQLEPSKKTSIEPLGSPETVELLVIGDTHIGRTEHPKTGAKIDPLSAFNTAINEGIERDVAAIIHVGDIFHETATPLHAEFMQQDILTPLRNAAIPFYYVEGNHTSEAGRESLKEASEDFVHCLDLTGTTVGAAVRIYGLNHYPMGDIEWANVQFPRAMNESTSILVLHQTLDQLSGTGPKSVDLERIQERAPKRFDFILSGHHHDALRCRWQGTPVMYTGAAETMSKNEAPDDRIAWFLHVENGSVSLERYDIPD